MILKKVPRENLLVFLNENLIHLENQVFGSWQKVPYSALFNLRINRLNELQKLKMNFIYPSVSPTFAKVFEASLCFIHDLLRSIFYYLLQSHKLFTIEMKISRLKRLQKIHLENQIFRSWQKVPYPALSVFFGLSVSLNVCSNLRINLLSGLQKLIMNIIYSDVNLMFVEVLEVSL